MKYLISTTAIGDLNMAYPVGYTWDVPEDTFNAVIAFLRERAEEMKGTGESSPAMTKESEESEPQEVPDDDR